MPKMWSRGKREEIKDDSSEEFWSASRSSASDREFGADCARNTRFSIVSSTSRGGHPACACCSFDVVCAPFSWLCDPSPCCCCANRNPNANGAKPEEKLPLSPPQPAAAPASAPQKASFEPLQGALAPAVQLAQATSLPGGAASPQLPSSPLPTLSTSLAQSNLEQLVSTAMSPLPTVVRESRSGTITLPLNPPANEARMSLNGQFVNLRVDEHGNAIYNFEQDVQVPTMPSPQMDPFGWQTTSI